MPMNDAIALIGRSFEQYVETLREKANATGPKRASIGAPRVFLPATQEVAYLLNLLADNRALTIDELSQVIKYLEERRDKLIDAERRPLATDEAIVHLPSTSQEVEKSHMPTTEEITNKILSIFSSAGGSLQGVPPLNGASQQVQPPPPPPPPPVSTVASSASLINFDNPNVQKALDNLIQSSPVLMKNFNAKASTSEAHMSETTTNVSSSYGTLRPGGIMSSSTDHQQMGPGGGPPMMGKQKDMSGYGRPPMGGFSQQGLRPPSNQHY